MRTEIACILAVAALALSGIFVRAKIRNDSAIAHDTKRAADALERLQVNQQQPISHTPVMPKLGKYCALLKQGKDDVVLMSCNEQYSGQIICQEE